MKPWRKCRILVEIPVREHTDADVRWEIERRLDGVFQRYLRSQGPIGRVQVKSLARFIQGKSNATNS